MFIEKFLQIQNQLRIYHWQTKSFAEHKALGKAYEGLDLLIDNFVETYFGAHGVHKVSTVESKNGVRKEVAAFNISLSNYGTNSSNKLLDDAISFLTNDLESVVEKNTDLLNIRDEMLSILNKTKYLLTLN